MNNAVRRFFIYCICILLLPSFVCAATASDYFNAGKTLQERESWYEAIEQYLEAVQMNPAYGEAWYSLAECCYENGEYDLALTYLTQADSLIKNSKVFFFFVCT